MFKYYNSPKGNHDFKDYFRAIIIIMMMITFVLWIVKSLFL